MLITTKGKRVKKSFNLPFLHGNQNSLPYGRGPFIEMTYRIYIVFEISVEVTYKQKMREIPFGVEFNNHIRFRLYTALFGSQNRV